MKYLSICIPVLLIIASGCGNNPENRSADSSGRILSPEEEMQGFSLPDGFVIELVASESDGIVNPIQISFDDKGRLWTQTASMYPLDPVADIQWNDLLALMDNPGKQEQNPAFKRIKDLYQGKEKGKDKILVLSNLYDSENKVKTTVWADGLAIPMSVLPMRDGAYVAQGSELFFLQDSNNDGVADKRTPLFTGFGYTDTHTMTHMLIRGPGGWIYFSHGALNKGEVRSLTSGAKLHINYSKIGRFSLDGSRIELVNAGLNNIWGLQLRDDGQWYATEANDLGYSVVPIEAGTAFPGIGNERLHPYQPFLPELHDFRVGGTGISSLAFADDDSGSFPEEWRDVALLANPITSTINAVRIKRNPDGTVSAEHLPDLLTSTDKFFRPVNMEFGPDGCLYVADWYDKIISHNEVPTTDPNRDKSHGRIWRIRHVSQRPREIPDFNSIPTEDLVKHLRAPSLWAKRAAWHQISDRPKQETKGIVGDLVRLAGDENAQEVSRILALWSLEGIGYMDKTLMLSLLANAAPDLRREAVRAFATFGLPDTMNAAIFTELIEDPNPMVRSQVIRTLTDIGKADHHTINILVRACKPDIEGNALGGPYERKFERYLALKALEQYPDQLNAYLAGPSADDHPVANRLWAIQALPEKQKEVWFFPLWRRAGIQDLDEPTFIWIAKMLENPTVYRLVEPLINKPSQAAKYLNMALNNQQQVQSVKLSSMLTAPALQLLRNGSESDKHLALDAIGRMDIPVPGTALAAVIHDDVTASSTALVLKALENDINGNKMYFVEIAENDQFDFQSRVLSLHNIVKVDSAKGMEIVSTWLPAMENTEKQTLVDVLSGSNEGSGMLISLYRSKWIADEAFSTSSADRVYNSHPNSPASLAIVNKVKEREEARKKAFDDKLHHYMAIAERKTGDAAKGKIIFQTCLMCHRVGQEGQDIAPALDGSAARGNETVLTALLAPDAAIEGGYQVYRVTKKDNSSVEGYLYAKDDKGITISFMGGNKVFIQRREVKSEGFVGNRSFMPTGLIENFTDEQVADLLAYIRTLE